MICRWFHSTVYSAIYNKLPIPRDDRKIGMLQEMNSVRSHVKTIRSIQRSWSKLAGRRLSSSVHCLSKKICIAHKQLQPLGTHGRSTGALGESEPERLNSEMETLWLLCLSRWPPSSLPNHYCVSTWMRLHQAIMRPDRALRGARGSATSIRGARLNAVPRPDRVALPPSA